MSAGNGFFYKNKKITIIEGGRERKDSVFLALSKLKTKNYKKVLIHDAARPFVPKNVFNNVIENLDKGSKVVIPVINVVDTIKTVENNKVQNTLDRTKLKAVQTPQGFARDVLSEIYANSDLKPTTDDAGLAELAGIVVSTVEGSVESFKITTAFDLEMAKSFYENGK